MVLSRKTVFGFASERDAVDASAVLGEAPGWDAIPLVLREDGSQWFLECYDDGVLSGEAAAALCSSGLSIISQSVEGVPQTDWVTETQRMLPPIRAGRFIVHGSHDRARIHSQWAIEVDAGRAFGTAHHGTTKGCLMAIDELASTTRARSVLDLGTGSGVLAIAAAKAFQHGLQIAAVDVDPIAIEVARENCRNNGVAESVKLFVGNGLKPGSAYTAAPFDVVTANILARPLLKLAPRLRELTKRGGNLILSGLLTEQARELLARYQSTGFHLRRRSNLEGWSTLLLERTR
jgi:ribosomal protein L11 methyltransferase